jgi:hypothetical protein
MKKPMDDKRYYCGNCGAKDIEYFNAGRRYLIKCKKCGSQNIQYDQFMPLKYTNCLYMGNGCSLDGICPWKNDVDCPFQASFFKRLKQKLFKF